MASDILSQERIVTALSSIVTAIGNTAEVRLFTEGPELSPNTAALEDFTQPVGTWYDTEDHPLVTTAYGDPHLNADGEYEVTHESVQYDFIEDETNEPVTIKGYLIVKADGTEVYHYGYLDEPVDLATNLDAVIFMPKFSLPKVPA